MAEAMHSEIGLQEAIPAISLTIKELPYTMIDMNLIRKVSCFRVSWAAGFTSVRPVHEIAIYAEGRESETRYSLRDACLGFAECRHCSHGG